MLKHLFLTAILVIPTTVLALDIQPGSPYIDVKAGSKEAPAINLLTRAGVVQGIGEGRFGPSRLVNRAEFLKMAMSLYLQAHDNPFSGYSYYKNGKVTQDGCFPDVRLSDWFGEYVCEAYDAGFVQGNPDGLFHPSRTVQYDEALKMMTLIFGYEIPSVQGKDWVEPYYQSAVARKVDLPIRIRFNSPLTRAYAARLIAAFKAEADGELQNLRFAESNRFDLISSVSSSSSSSTSSSSSSTSSSQSSSPSSSLSSSSSSAPMGLFTLPLRSHFLLVGAPSDAIADITIPAQSERTFVAIAQVKLFAEARSLQNLELVTDDGKVVATLLRKVTTDTDDYKLTFDAQIPIENQFALAKDMSHHLVLRATVRTQENGGFSEELVQVRTLTVTLRGETTNTTHIFPSLGGFPKHQTSFGRIAEVRTTPLPTTELRAGTGMLLGSIVLKPQATAGKSIALDALVFTYQKTGSFTFTSPIVVSGTKKSTCTINDLERTISCPLLASQFGPIASEGLPIEIRANIVLPAGSKDNSMQVSLPSAGSPEALGSIHWTDGTANFRWVDLESPLLTGNRLQ